MREYHKKRLELLERSMTGTWSDSDNERTERDLRDFLGIDLAGEYFRANNMRKLKCCICGESFWDYTGCNPDPIVVDEDAVCCHSCDRLFVLPARMGRESGCVVNVPTVIQQNQETA